MAHGTASTGLPAIPVLDTGPDFPLETLQLEEARAHALIDAATHLAPAPVLRALDLVSRRWLSRWNNAHLAEIDTIAKRLGRPGAYFLSVNYEWGCTCQVSPSPERTSARLIRVLDWRTRGLGRNIVAARVRGAAGPFTTLTWPGYTGVLQAMAPQRFSAALNQAPMRKTVGVFALDWAANRGRVWNMPHPTAAHVLRDVFERAADFETAKEMLRKMPIAAPAIFSLAGLKPNELAVIERCETEARVHEGCNVAANHWQEAGWSGHPRGVDSAGRACLMHRAIAGFDPDFSWLRYPVLNHCTRLAMIADAAEGRILAQGYEADGPATQVLSLISGTVRQDPHPLQVGKDEALRAAGV